LADERLLLAESKASESKLREKITEIMNAQVQKLESTAIEKFEDDPKSMLIKNLEADNKKLREDLA
jgi:hypothetical protein